MCYRLCHVMFWVRTQHWASRAVLFPTIWGQQKSDHSFRAPAPLGLCQPGGEAGATGWSYFCSERELPRGHRTKQEAGWARQPRSVDLFVSHIREDITAVNSSLNLTDTMRGMRGKHPSWAFKFEEVSPSSTHPFCLPHTQHLRGMLEAY